MSPSFVCNRATVWPHGSVLGPCSSSCPFDLSKEAARVTPVGLGISNSMNT